MKQAAIAVVTAMLLLFMPSRADAGELFGGLYAHDIGSPLTASADESGVDVQAGWRGAPIGKTPLQPYALVSLHSAGKTHFAAVGLSAKFGDRIFIRPGLGVAVHTGTTGRFERPGNDEKEFGSRVLFEPELGVGMRVNDRVTVEASWVHLSHAQLGSSQNPGMDSVGVRFSLKL